MSFPRGLAERLLDDLRRDAVARRRESTEQALEGQPTTEQIFGGGHRDWREVIDWDLPTIR